MATTTTPSAPVLASDRTDGYGDELEASYPGLTVRLSLGDDHYVVTRLRDRRTVVAYGTELRGVCAGLTGIFDNRLDRTSKRIAGRIMVEEMDRWDVPHDSPMRPVDGEDYVIAGRIERPPA